MSANDDAFFDWCDQQERTMDAIKAGVTTCSLCNGEGLFFDEDCPRCKGSGALNKDGSPYREYPSP